MKVVKPIAAVLALLLTCVLVPAAGAKTLRASGGGVSAKVTFTVNQKTLFTSSPQITVTHRGGPTYSGAVNASHCGSGYCEGPELTVANLDGADEVVASVFTGGAHCCSIATIFWQNSRGDWRRYTYDFADPGFRLKDLDHNGQREFLTADDRFAYLLSDYADSGMPIQVIEFTDGTFIDVTRAYPALITRDAAQYWKIYQRDHSGEQIGQFAPWAADEDNLGNESMVSARLAAQVVKGRITAEQADKLQHYLKTFGYTQ
jgi:hypothetical protein